MKSRDLRYGLLLLAIVGLLLGLLVACNRAEPPGATAAVPETPATLPPVVIARAELAASSGSKASGNLVLTAIDGGVAITGEIMGLAPGVAHGFHVHETGDCSAPDAKSAGAHLNPGEAEHGDPAGSVHHLGDLANLNADTDGKASVNTTLMGGTLRDGTPTDLVGKAFIVHEKRDDYVSQPAGDSGDRIACGVVR